MPKPRREGYLLIDHRDSPGITPEEAHAAGRGAFAVPGGKRHESGTITCTHCCAIVVLNPMRKRPRNYCPKCDAYICDGCAATAERLGCRPLDKMFDYIQDQNGRLFDLGIPVTTLPDLEPLWSKVSVQTGVNLPVESVPGSFDLVIS